MEKLEQFTLKIFITFFYGGLSGRASRNRRWIKGIEKIRFDFYYLYNLGMERNVCCISTI